LVGFANGGIKLCGILNTCLKKFEEAQGGVFFNDEAYSLCTITKLMLSREQMIITAVAMEKLKNIYDTVRGNKDFGNGRFVRKTLEQAEMNLAERAAQLDESKLTTKLITTIEERDIPESDVNK